MQIIAYDIDISFVLYKPKLMACGISKIRLGIDGVTF